MDKDLAARMRLENARAVEIDDPDGDIAAFRVRFGSDLSAGKIAIPPLPELAVRLHKIATSADPDVREAAQLVERDPNLAGQILKIASSVAYGSNRQITDLRQAILRIGVKALRDLAYALAMGSVFRCGALAATMQEVNAHSYVVARGTAELCPRVGLGDEYGFLCGLLHDIGRVALLSALADYGRKAPMWLKPELVTRISDEMHQQVAGLVLAHWGVHSLVKSVALSHHAVEQADAFAQNMTRVVAVADVADHLNVTGAEQRAMHLEILPIVRKADLSKSAILALATAIEAARSDPLLQVLTAEKKGPERRGTARRR